MRTFAMPDAATTMGLGVLLLAALTITIAGLVTWCALRRGRPEDALAILRTGGWILAQILPPYRREGTTMGNIAEVSAEPMGLNETPTEVGSSGTSGGNAQ